ncbi:hypothetical protein ACSQ67_016582 [Phaseolus vulgaris]
MKPLVEVIVNLDHRGGSRGLVALHMATGYMRLDVAKLLLDLNMDLEVADDRGRIGLDLAREVRRRHRRGIDAIRARGLDSRAWLGF